MESWGSPASREKERAGGGAAAPMAVAAPDELKAETIDLEEAFERIGYGWQQTRVLIICGLCFCTDSIGGNTAAAGFAQDRGGRRDLSPLSLVEVGLLSFLQVEAKKEYNLSTTSESLLSSIVFAGEMVGALLFGPLADRYGRKTATVTAACLVAAAGVGRQAVAQPHPRPLSGFSRCGSPGLGCRPAARCHQRFLCWSCCGAWWALESAVRRSGRERACAAWRAGLTCFWLCLCVCVYVYVCVCACDYRGGGEAWRCPLTSWQSLCPRGFAGRPSLVLSSSGVLAPSSATAWRGPCCRATPGVGLVGSAPRRWCWPWWLCLGCRRARTGS